MNHSFQDPEFKDGDVIESGNFSQLVPHTEICKGVTDLTINGGNFVNCKPQPGWVLNGGNWGQVEFCTHESPQLIARGLTPCGEDCQHRSAEKVQRTVGEKEYRQKKLDAKDIKLPITDEDLTVEKSVDDDGITVQVFTISEYEYKPKKVVKGGYIRRRKFDYAEVVE